MKTKIAVFFFGLTLVVLSGKTTLAQEPLGDNGVISGIVYETDGTTPVCDVEVIADDFGEWETSATTVSPTGTYSMSLPAGTYRVVALGSGLALEYYNEAGPDGNNATPVAVTAGVTTSDVNFTLDPGGVITGTVYASNGVTPLENINVSPAGVWVGTCTDSDGRYVLENVPISPIKIYDGGNGNWCGGPEYYIKEWWQEAAAWEDATPITLTASIPISLGSTLRWG